MKSTAPVKKNQQLDVTITDLTFQGLGLAKVDDFSLFIETPYPAKR